MFIRIAAFVLGMAVLSYAAAAEAPIARISAHANGALFLNGNTADLRSIDAELSKLQEKNGVVWYYRESGQSQPHPQAVAVTELIVKHRLPVSMSTKADFSDYVDRDGNSRPRKP